MAKGNSNKKQAAANGSEKPMPAYFKSLTIENVKCFKGEHTIDLSDGKGKPAQWTVILGNNNTGKTTILKCLAGLEPKEINVTIGPQGTLFEEIKTGQKPSINQKIAGPIFLFTELGDEFFSPTHGKLEFSITSKILLRENNSDLLSKAQFKQFNYVNSEDWGYRLERVTNNAKFLLGPLFMKEAMTIYSYGASRRMTKRSFSEGQEGKPHSGLFENRFIANVEDWLLNLFLADKLGQSEAKNSLEIANKVLVSGLLPDVHEVHLRSEEKGAGFENFVEFHTDFGWIRLRDLGYGYQTMIAWVLDLVKRMVERYPDSSNPLAEPAIVLVDEIDLHLHPDWQRRIIAHLTKYFPNTQFIVTAHSPLIVQSAEEINLVILKKEGESVHIEQPKIRTFRGWTVEEILTDLMALEGQTMSQTYLDLMQQFDDALDADDFEKAEAAYGELDKILHPNSHQRKLLQLQMTSLSPADAV